MQVALFGVSYDAGAAVRAAAQQHPAVKAKLFVQKRAVTTVT